jgi:hypothetical protein
MESWISITSLAICLRKSEDFVINLLQSSNIDLADMTYFDVVFLLHLCSLKHTLIKHVRSSTVRYSAIEKVTVPILYSLNQMRKRADEAYTPLYLYVDSVKEKQCEVCKTTKCISHHHKDLIHENMVFGNIMLVCWNCHKRFHHQSKQGIKQLTLVYRMLQRLAMECKKQSRKTCQEMTTNNLNLSIEGITA